MRWLVWHLRRWLWLAAGAAKPPVRKRADGTLVIPTAEVIYLVPPHLYRGDPDIKRLLGAAFGVPSSMLDD